MNYLAHAYLSFGNKEILAGNMISDFVKGKKKFDYPPGIQKGIYLHRMIDVFTDAHAATKEARLILKPSVGLYAGAFVDVIYDHFLATDKKEFAADALKNFADLTYKTLHEYIHLLPEKFSQMLPYMSSQNWLYNYSTLWGTEKSFGGVSRRALYLKGDHEAFKTFEQHYYLFQQCYDFFFPDVKQYAFTQFKELENN